MGRLLLVLALLAAAYTVVMTAWAYRVAEPKRGAILASAHNAALAVWGLLTAACLSLTYLFLTNDFSVNYVWGHSSVNQPLIFKISALWGGQAGSLLLWAWMLALYGLVLALYGRRTRNEIAPTAVAVLTSVSVFFVGLVVFVANPFARVDGPVPSEGIGLNPLLQNYWMQIHPPTLYAGYVGCTVPFAWAAAALLHRRFDKDWVELVRRWTLLPWIILTCGIIMGGAWAYETLGWGGYWAWDPVENASLMPWLTATAFLHSIMIQGRRGMLKNWNVVLVSLTFLLSIFGTFLTRSGVVASVHSFAESKEIGTWFLTFLALALIFSFGLILWRRDDLSSRAEFDSVFSREGAFLLNNWILLCAAFAVLWGTVYPAIREALTGEQTTVGAPYFNRVMAPLGLLILALTGIGPLMAWRRSSPGSLLRTLRIPILAGLATAPLLWLLST
ncbi:MAG: cytochrome c biogenesis protein CcsA, partial [Armatimonadota bacterium]|nr:cytochrome c biogenesis protein CcsA [Armatimonadota bacterium]